MNSGIARFVSALGLMVGAAACSAKAPTQPTPATTTSPAPATPAAIVLSAPTPVTPTNGATTNGWPTFTVTDAVRSGSPAAPLVYRFDVATGADFGTIALTATVSETPNQTNFTPAQGQAPPPQTALFWRVIAIDPINVVASKPSAVQSFTYAAPPSMAATLSTQEGAVLWPGAQPPGNPGHATLGNAWDVGTRTSFDGADVSQPRARRTSRLRSPRSRARSTGCHRLDAQQRLSNRGRVLPVRGRHRVSISVHGAHRRPMGSGPQGRRVGTVRKRGCVDGWAPTQRGWL